MADPARGPRLRHVSGLDGVRALAVLAVMAYHNFSWLPGGFYGVDAFFVLSGFLITSLLVTEWEGSGTVKLGRFWSRRARRLLPALFVMVAAVGLVAVVWPSVFGAVDLLPGALATVFYGANWYFIAGHASYFTAGGAPSPLLHTWSLAIEEQFYLVWPLVVLAVLGTGWRRRRRAARVGSEAEAAAAAAAPAVGAAPDVGMAAGAGAGAAAAADGRVSPSGAARARHLDGLFVLSAVGAVASAVLMAVLAPAGGLTTRAYYGTDTRAQALLVGAALAAAFARWGGAKGTRSCRVFAGLACAGLAGTFAAWALVSFTSSLAFHGGFLLVSLAAAAVVAGIVQAPRGPVAMALAWGPVRALGRVSYGVYLWYWPVLLVMTAQRVDATGWLLFGERAAVTVGLATVSYHVVEMPVRRGALPGWRGLMAAPVGAGLALAVIGAATLVPAGEAAPSATRAPLTTGPTSPAGSAAGSAPGPGTAGGSTATGASNIAAAARLSHPVKVLLVGDSIAGSLGVGLDRAAAGYGVELVNEGSPGCSVSMDQLIRVLWYTIAPGAPCRAGDPGALLHQWRSWVDSFNPDVVVYVARGELFDQEVTGRWSALGAASFDDYVRHRFSRAIQVLGSKGAAVVMLTTPYYDSGRQPSGALWPEDDPERVTIDNSIIERAVKAAEAAGKRAGAAGRADATAKTAASGRAGASGKGGASGRAGAPRVSVFDLGSLVSPGGHYDRTVDGVDMRCSDGVHFTAAGGEWVARRLLPVLVGLARSHEAASPGGSWPGAAPPPVPGWWSELPCG